ncbi:UTP:RNA uridylyltransferase 1 [Andrographis paniculata]|uniref:UTP:RNA uridylyltransferase 1 n=1 Tax=Andrographis paniculata TaxID=175694 RepID=UPI0021E98E42|nr:UTP:RNA uridylyltransferase 1 [Andrographis paniculata]
MNNRGIDGPPANGGEFLLQLLRNPSNAIPPAPLPQHPPSQALPQDPAVAAVGPTIPAFLPPPHAAFPINGLDLPSVPWNHSTSPPFALHNFFQQNPRPNPNLNPDLSPLPAVFGHASHQFNLHSSRAPSVDDSRTLGSYGDASKPGVAHQPEQVLIFGSLNREILQNQAPDVLHQSFYRRNRMEEGLGMDRKLNAHPLNPIGVNGVEKSTTSRVHDREGGAESYNRRKEIDNGSYRAVAPPPGFSNNLKNVNNREVGFVRRSSDHDVDKGKGSHEDMYRHDRLSNQLESPGLPAGSSLTSASAFDIEESMKESHGKEVGGNNINRDRGKIEMDDLEDQFVESLGLDDESGEKNDKKKYQRDKDYRSDKRGKWIMAQRMRNLKRFTVCRKDINNHNAPFLAVFQSLIPADEEKVKQKQLLVSLEKIITKEWPGARLYLYGSCANTFGFSKSDIDVCLTMEPGSIDKSEVLLKLADMLQSDNLQNVQALTRARVPVVKLMDPATGISCDICINNLLAVVNTKLLRDYARIDARLRQLAFIIKHWAKSRGVNQTYQGTLSSYAYVIMCIHFLQRRSPPILPCLQRMEVTYSAKLDNIECAYFDRVEMLQNFGSQNREGVAQLVWGFFHYWAYCHDYANDVISVRTGSTIRKAAKDWTRRVGNDRHLICIEDPFEVSHDLGRVVDRYSIRVLREEFERAAEIIQHDPNPSVTLFEPYVPE